MLYIPYLLAKASAPSLPIPVRLKPEREYVDTVVNHAEDTQQQDPCHAERKADARIAVAAQRCDRLFVGRNVHRLHDQQVVIERNHRIDKRDEHQQVETTLECCSEDEELREEPGKRRDACQREERQGHHQGQFALTIFAIFSGSFLPHAI